MQPAFKQAAGRGFKSLWRLIIRGRVMENIKNKYSELEKKHKLPKFDEINKDFEISSIDKEDFLLREVRRKITEKMDIYIEILDRSLQPEAVICDMHECKALSEEEKKNAYELYKKLMYFKRYSFETSFDEDDAKASKFVNSFWKDWPLLKKELRYVAVKLKESWLNDTDIKEDLGYMG